MVFPSGTPAKLAVGFGREGLPGREKSRFHPKSHRRELPVDSIDDLRFTFASARRLVPPLLPIFLVCVQLDRAGEIGQD